MTLRIGVCEDDPAIRKVLARGLREAGHDVFVAHNGAEALSLLSAKTSLDVLMLDIGLPDSDGRDVAQALKASGQHAPILFLTALGQTHDVLAGFAAGGDDYVVKPFVMREVLARLEVLALRARPAPGTAGLILDPVAHVARTNSGHAPLTPTEFRMLAAIVGRPGEVVRRRAVVAAGWPDGAMVSENTIDSFMRKIRSKLESIDSPVSIETVRGLGFRTTGDDAPD